MAHAVVCLPAQRQVQIVDLGGLKLLLPLTKSVDVEVQRLAAHALANLSVNSACGAVGARFHTCTAALMPRPAQPITKSRWQKRVGWRC